MWETLIHLSILDKLKRNERILLEGDQTLLLFRHPGSLGGNSFEMC